MSAALIGGGALSFLLNYCLRTSFSASDVGCYESTYEYGFITKKLNYCTSLGLCIDHGSLVCLVWGKGQSSCYDKASFLTLACGNEYTS